MVRTLEVPHIAVVSVVSCRYGELHSVLLERRCEDFFVYLARFWLLFALTDADQTATKKVSRQRVNHVCVVEPAIRESQRGHRGAIERR